MVNKFQYFDGLHFTRDEKTGYYLCSKRTGDGVRKRMHVYVWEYYNGPVPEGFHVHHADEDKANNDIENLELLKGSVHLSLHGKANAVIRHDEMVKILSECARPKAKEWHRSDAGRLWHKAHYLKMQNRLYSSHEFVCQNCGKEFQSSQVNSKFCSNSCKSVFRRKSGIDNVVRKCECCGTEFEVNRYTKRRYCSNGCSYKAVPRGGKVS